MTVEERFAFVVLAQEGVVNRVRGQGGGHGQIPAGKSFGEDEKIRLNPFGMTREKKVLLPGRNRATQSGHHFVSNEQCAIAAQNLVHLTQPALGMGNHSGGTLQGGFHNHGRVRLACSGLTRASLFDLADAFPVAIA